MKLFKKTKVSYSKPRSIYDDYNMIYTKKPNPSDKKDEMRLERRMKKINKYADEETREPPINHLTSEKSKVVFKMLNENLNNNRLSRKKMPAELKKEYIEKCKEFSLYKTHQWRQQNYEISQYQKNQESIYRSAAMLPLNLLDEVVDIEGFYENEYEQPNKYLWEEGEVPTFSKDDIAEESEYYEENTYFPQYLRILPDDYHTIMKTIVNLEVYEEDKHSASLEDSMDIGIDEEEK